MSEAALEEVATHVTAETLATLEEGAAAGGADDDQASPIAMARAQAGQAFLAKTGAPGFPLVLFSNGRLKLIEPGPLVKHVYCKFEVHTNEATAVLPSARIHGNECSNTAN